MFGNASNFYSKIKTNETIYLHPPLNIVKIVFSKQIYSQYYPANTSTLNQPCDNVDRQRSSTLFQRWYLVENESWADVHFSMLFQRWKNNVETTSIKLHRFNVDYQTLFQRWYLVENESWADVCLSTLFQRWQNNVEITLIELRQFNVHDSMFFKRRYLVENESWTNACLPALIWYLLYW